MASSPRTWSLERRLDLIGLVLVLALGVWVGLFAGAGEGRPAPVLALLGGIAIAYAVGQGLAQHGALLHQSVAGAVAGSVVLTWPGILAAGGEPTGYANANATITALGCIAALGAAVQASSFAARRGWAGLSLLLTAATALTGSVAGTVALLVALGLLGLGAASRWPPFPIVGGLCIASIVLGATVAIALGADPAGLGERAGVRGELWAAAAAFADEEPMRGIGPGMFAERNPVSSDADLRWAHHGHLQTAAELGVVGWALVLAVGGWAWVRLWHASASGTRDPTLGGAVLVVVGLHGAVDYVWHVPAVMVLAAGIVGVVCASTVTVAGDAPSIPPMHDRRTAIAPDREDHPMAAR